MKKPKTSTAATSAPGLQYAARTGKTYYLQSKPGKTGQPNYFFALKPGTDLVATVPAGYEIYENVRGLVFLRRQPKPCFTPEELAKVREALNHIAPDWRHHIEVKPPWLIVHQAEDPAAKVEMWKELTGEGNPAQSPRFLAWVKKNAQYTAVMRFDLRDTQARIFQPQRYCFRGAVDRWIEIGPPDRLAPLLKNYLPHLVRASFYELY